MKAAAWSGQAAAARFHLVSRWHLAASIERVWAALTAPQWWPYVRSVEELAPGDAAGLYARHRIAWSGSVAVSQC